MRVFSLGLIALSASPCVADQVDDCIRSNVEVIAASASVEVDAIGFDLTIRNGLSSDLGGAIVRYELWSADRPKALSAGYAQFSHTLGGGLLSGEAVTLREFIGLPDHTMELAQSASDLKIIVELENVADLEMHPFGTSYDPFALWKQDRSDQLCKRRSG